ncbi:hypothetical protein CCP2SC5_970004 [Azospirillaceae bacterium]
MDNRAFRSWLAQIDEFTSAQREELEHVLSERPPRAAGEAIIEGSPVNERRCSHCGHEKSVSLRWSRNPGQGDKLRSNLPGEFG